MFMDIMDTTIVNVALPTLQREFDATTAAIEWVVLGYLLSLAVWIPASGWIGDRFGTKKMFLFALAMFTIASALCGQAHSLAELIVFRVLQGVGGGMLDAGRHRDVVPRLPADRAGQGVDRADHPDGARARARADRRRLARHRRVVALDLLRQPADRRLRLRRSARLFLREHREPTAGRFDLPGFVLSGAGSRSSSTRSRKGPRRGGARRSS